MTTTHELGHIACGWLTGGELQDFDLAPWSLPHSLFAPDPFPLITLWGGPIIGVVAPLLVAFVTRWQAMWLVAYFCMLANGLYLIVSWIVGDRYLDGPRLIEEGTHPFWLILFSAVTILLGYTQLRRTVLQICGRKISEPSCGQSGDSPKEK